MQISSYAQELMCYMGQYLVFQSASDVLQVTKGVEFCPKQIERICHLYGSWLEQEEKRTIKEDFCYSYSREDQNSTHYASVDGSMYLTREKTGNWKEVKLGRIFKHNQIVEINRNRSEILESTYVGHLGSVKGFLPKMEYYLEGLDHFVILADGAKWIWNWADDIYPKSVQILDYFHAKEHLCDFAKEYFEDKKQRERWVKKQGNILLEQSPSQVIENIQNLSNSHSIPIEKKKDNLIQYYTNNLKRMNYKEYLEKGYIIGSGAVEAAHRDVLQQRLKLSGQRWTKEGLQQMIQLRVINKSGKWNKIRELAKKIA